jgi:hypothetical protein
MINQMSAIVQQTVDLRVSAHLNALRPAACARSCHCLKDLVLEVSGEK